MNEVLIGVACEDGGHFRAVTCLIDQRCLAAHAWLDGVLEDCRKWCGGTAENGWLKLSSTRAKNTEPREVGGRTFKRHGHIDGQPLKEGAAMWRRVLDLFLGLESRPDVVVLVRDSDRGDPKPGIVQVREGIPWPFPVVMAVPHPEVEAWFVSGFEPQSANEKAQLDRLKKDLSFDPTTQSHRLTSQPSDSPRDAKRVLSQLCATEERRDQCLTDMNRLRDRGKKNGLAEFLDETDERIVPLFGGPAAGGA